MNSETSHVFGSFGEPYSSGSHPSDTEIALLAFENWKLEGSPYLRPEHWKNAERALQAMYAGSVGTVAVVEPEALDEYWEHETETSSGYAQFQDGNPATKGWS